MYRVSRSMTIFRDQLLSGQVALVTGGGSGIGFGIAERFAQHGAKVAILGRNAERLAGAKAQLEPTSTDVETLAVDVRDYAAVEAGMRRVAERFGRLDIVVNSAAGNFIAPAA